METNDDHNRVRSSRDLLVWQKGIDLTKAVYSLTQRFPAEERLGLVSQLRRAAVSVPSHIAEGQVRRSSVEFAQFLSVSLGSLAELETQLIIASELTFATRNQAQAVIERIHELQKMLHTLRSKLPFCLTPAPLLSSILVRLPPIDPVAFLGVSLLPAGMAAGPSYLPARRASRVDPMEALRHE